jgi:hypothetical protein
MTGSCLLSGVREPVLPLPGAIPVAISTNNFALGNLIFDSLNTYSRVGVPR